MDLEDDLLLNNDPVAVLPIGSGFAIELLRGVLTP